MSLPEPLNTDWSSWLIGEWIGMGEGAIGKAEHLMTFELGLDGQFLLYKYVSRITEMSEDHIHYLKDKLHLSDANIQRVRDTGFEELGIETLLPDSNEIVVHVFDSWRTILQGKGSWDGHKETVHFVNDKISGKRIIERVRHDKMYISQEWNMPDGSIMTETGEFKRVGAAS